MYIILLRFMNEMMSILVVVWRVTLLWVQSNGISGIDRFDFP